MALSAPVQPSSFDPMILGCLNGWMKSMVEEENLPFAQIVDQLQQDSLFRIYSMTKPITGLAMMMLFEQGLWSPEDKLSSILPEFSNMKKVVKLPHPENPEETFLGLQGCETPITLKHLLTHTAGLSHGLDPNGYTNLLDPMYHGKAPVPAGDVAEAKKDDAEARPFTQPPQISGMQAPELSLEDWVKALAQYPLISEPGSEFWYSYSIDVLGRVIEVLSGVPLEEFFQSQILDPLQMKDTFFRVPEDQMHRLLPNYAPHNSGKGLHEITTPTTKRFLADSQSLISGGSGLISTVNDYWKFAEVLRGRGRCPHSGIRFIGPRTYDFMVSNHLPGGKSMHELTHHPLVKPSVSKGMGMGFGLAVITDPIAGNSNASKGIVHWGGAASTLFWVDIEEDVQVLFFTQYMAPGNLPFLSRLLQFVYSALDSSPGPGPSVQSAL